VQMYLRIMNFSSEQEASIVQGYLRGTALAWWIQKLDNMSANDIPPPATFDEFMHYLNEQFDHRNPELAARDKLMTEQSELASVSLRVRRLLCIYT